MSYTATPRVFCAKSAHAEGMADKIRSISNSLNEVFVKSPARIKVLDFRLASAERYCASSGVRSAAVSLVFASFCSNSLCSKRNSVPPRAMVKVLRKSVGSMRPCKCMAAYTASRTGAARISWGLNGMPLGYLSSAAPSKENANS